MLTLVQLVKLRKLIQGRKYGVSLLIIILTMLLVDIPSYLFESTDSVTNEETVHSLLTNS